MIVLVSKKVGHGRFGDRSNLFGVMFESENGREISKTFIFVSIC